MAKRNSGSASSGRCKKREGRAGPSSFFSHTPANARVISATGRLAKKTPRQLNVSTSSPPAAGEQAGASRPTSITAADSFARSCGWKSCQVRDCPTGISNPPPIPCRARQKIRLPSESLSPQASAVALNSVSESIKSRRAPQRCVNQALNGTTSVRPAI